MFFLICFSFCAQRIMTDNGFLKGLCNEHALLAPSLCFGHFDEPLKWRQTTKTLEKDVFASMMVAKTLTNRVNPFVNSLYSDYWTYLIR